MRHLLCLACLLASPAMAQSVRPESVSTDELPPDSTHGRVLVDFAEVHAGAGAAYVSRGRVYQGDEVDVRRRSGSGDWIEITGGGLRGWVRARYLDLFRTDGGGASPAAVPTGRSERRLDPGRDRRETNYTYDEAGRRVRTDGDRAGSGEGAGRRGPESTMDEMDEPVDEGAKTQGKRFGVSLGVGAATLRRNFDTNIVNPSILRTVAAKPIGLGLELGARYDVHKYVATKGQLRLVRFATTTLPKAPNFGLDEPVDVAARALQIEADVIGRYPLGGAFVGVYTGPRYLSHAFAETQPFPVFLSTSIFSLGFGGAAGYAVDAFEVGASAGLLLPLSISQDPADSGDVQSSSGFELGGQVAYLLDRSFAIVGGFHFASFEIDYRGESTHADTTTSAGGAEKHYDKAKERDKVIGGNAGVRWSP